MAQSTLTNNLYVNPAQRQTDQHTQTITIVNDQQNVKGGTLNRKLKVQGINEKLIIKASKMERKMKRCRIPT